MRRRIAALLIGLALLTGGGAVWLFNWGERPGPAAQPITVLIAPEDGLIGIGGKLRDAGAIDNAAAFVVLAGATRWLGRLHAGEYQFPASSPAFEILAELRARRVLVHKLVVPEGLTSAEIVALIRSAPALAGEIAEPVSEGALWPATYSYEWGEQRDAMLRRLIRMARQEVAALWAKRPSDCPLATVEEAVTLASIVEKETALPAERPKIAQLFLNRLKLGMKLQSDPTVIYALSHGLGPLGRPLTRSDLDTPSPYNTYMVSGLPPGPITNPGRAAIEAVLHPEPTDALYFVANGTGGHAFATTLDAHQLNVANWRKIEAERQSGRPSRGIP